MQPSFAKKTVIVTTTIRLPRFLEDVFKNAHAYQRKDLCVIVIADKKTPLEARLFCASLSDRFCIPIEYYDIEEQEKELAAFPRLLKMMPYNSGSRKLIGNFMAYLRDCESLIMLDDDNFVAESDFFGEHAVVKEKKELDLFQTNSGWFNIYEGLIEERNIPFFPRGFPWKYRAYDSVPHTKVRRKVKVAVNNGLVLESPDIDAISRLFWPIRVLGIKKDFPTRFGLFPGTWSSWNNQNTALSKEASSVYFTPPSIGRNSDIWASFIVCRLTLQMGEIVSFGDPLVRQLRNPHDLWQDLEEEFLNNRLTDNFVSLIRSVPISKTTYREALGELLTFCLNRLEGWKELNHREKEVLTTFFKEYQVWHEACLKGAKCVTN